MDATWRGEVITTKQITTKEEVLELAFFIQKVVAAMPTLGGHSFEHTFKVLHENVDRGNLGIWVQYKNNQPIAFASAVINYALTGEVLCHLWLVYGEVGTDAKYVFYHKILPWAIAQGANKIQASDCTCITGRNKAKNRWYERFGMKKAFEIYEKELTLC